MWHSWRVWALNPANSRDLIDRLRPHGRDRNAEVGEGWRPLVMECHERLAAAFPDYELLAILSFGESWHNLHHSDPTCARHGVLKGQLDSSARLIWVLEKLQLASDVRWPDAARLTARQTGSAGRKLVAAAKQE
jgi:hypothetical protein